ncbi:MAG: hypothetical protein DRI86_11895, partial [Bacteroidetes bacterium]
VFYTTTATPYFTVVQGSVTCNSPSGSTSLKRPNIKIHTAGSNGCVSAKIPLTVDVPLPTIDANLSAITEPMDGCGLFSTPVSIEIVNNGIDTIPGGYSATYKLGNNAYITAETIALAIAPADTLIYTFNTLTSLASGTNGAYYEITAKLFVPNDAYSANDSLVVDSILSNYTPSNPITISSTINYSNTAVLSATAIDSVFWYSDSLGFQYLGANNGFITDPLYDTTTFYVQEQRSIAQSNYTIGTSSTNTGTVGPSPYGAGNYGAKMQFLITASELSALGMMQGPIHSLSFNVLYPVGSPLNSYTIKIANSTKISMLGANLETGLTTVYSESNYVDVAGWNEHQFSTPYIWDGHSSLIIETCFKNTTSTNFASVYYTQTSNISVAYNIGNSSFSCIDSAITGNSNHRPNIRLKQTGLATCASELIPLTVNIVNIPNTDAGITSITEPSGNVSSIIATHVKVILKNYGLSNMTSATINWTEKGIIQTPFMWAGNLAQNNIDTVTIATNHMFKGGSTNIDAWVELTNDTIHQNDTASMHKLICMSGNYSINSINGDYLNFTDAADDLNLVGVCGPVVFNADSGTYSGVITLYPIVGSSAINTITFQSTQLDSTEVVINNSDPNDYYIIRLIGASYVNIKHMTLKYFGGQSGSIIVLESGASNIELSSSIINIGYSVSSTTNASGIYANQQGINDILINNNKFIDGYSAIYFGGLSSSTNNNISILNNTFNGFNGQAVKAIYSNNVEVSSNIINSGTQGTNVNSIYFTMVNNFEISNNKIITRSSTQSYGMYLRGGGTSGDHSIISNNFSSTFGSSSVNCGIYIYLSSYVDIFYNSINVNDGGPTSKGMYVSGGSNIIAKNNSISSKAGYALYVTSVPSSYSFDYNNIYADASASNFVYWGTIISDLATLKTADINNNQNSVSSNPNYNSLTDLHAQGIDLYNSGTPISGITIDIDNDLRNTTTPCIGADEFSPPAIDLSLRELVYPYESSCSFSATDSIVVRIKNMGLNTLNFSSTNATIKIYLSGISTDTITYILNTGSLTVGDEMNVKVSNSYNISSNGMYTFDGEISIANDGNTINDIMLQKSIVNYPNINSFPFNENFETGVNISFKETNGSQSSIGVTNAAANTSIAGLNFSGGSNIGWTLPSTVTQAYNNTSHIATASSCNIDASSAAALYLQFNLRQTKYSSYNSKSSWFRVLLTDANSNTYYLKNFNGDSVFMPITANSDPFQIQTYDLSMFVGQNFQISFESSCRYILGFGSNDGDNAYVDDIIIWEPSAKDVAVKSTFSNNLFGHSGTNMVISTSFSNMGIDTLYTIPLAYQVNNGIVVRDTAIGTFIPFESDSFTFTSNYILNNGLQNLCVFAELPNDAEAANDTACSHLKGLNTFFASYSDDFEANNEWFPANAADQWQLGTPNSSFITNAHSGQNAWTTILNGNHSTSTEDYLYSPYLIVPTYADTAVLEFWMTMNVNTLDVYSQLEYSFDGILWIPLGYYGDPNSNNWYNKAINGKHVWSHSNYSWAESNIKLDPSVFNTGNSFQMRFTFNSGTNPLSSDGWAIDDFKITIPPMQIDAGVESIINPTNSIITGSVTTVSVMLKNYGNDTLTSIPISYSINGNVISNETWSGVLPLDSSVVYTFSTTYISGGTDYILCAYTDLSNDMVIFNDSACVQILSIPGNQDAGISSMIAPFGQTTIGQATQVKVMIYNYGNDTLYSVPVEYLIGGNSQAIETFTGTIVPFDSAAYTFTTTYNSAAGIYTICAITQLANDVDPVNDQKCVTVIGTSIDHAKGDRFMVAQNRPNPAKNNTEIEFYLPKSGNINFRIVDMLGAVVENQQQTYSQGKQIIRLNPTNYAEGIYFYSISFDGEVKTFKMIIVR